MLRGLPASGKSTWAKQQVKEKIGVVRINKDDLRAMIYDSEWSNSHEQFIIAARNALVITALKNGNDVIVDDTNFAPAHEVNLRFIANKYGAEFEIKDFYVSLNEALKRDSYRQKPVGRTVIQGMYRRYEQARNVPQIEPYPHDPALPSAIICDIDGTLAHIVSRSPYDWSRVSEDTVDTTVKALLETQRRNGFRIIVMSGRDGSCAEDTLQWLEYNNIAYDKIYMRPAGNTEKDAIIKRQLFDKYVRGKYNVEYILDDRNQVVQMWREMGLKVLQVADGDF